MKLSVYATVHGAMELDVDGDDVEVEAAWEHEILSRIQGVDDGTAVGIAFADVMHEAEKRLARCN